jgi:hypothetical protein
MPYERRGVDTSTPAAEAEITAAVVATRKADQILALARDGRDRLLREHYAAGVDPRDLHRIVTAAGWTVHLGHIKRIVKGARPGS